MDTPEIDWKPELSVLMQEVEPGIYQEVQNSSDTTDSLVIQSEPLQASSLAAHLQQAINQLKADPNYKVTREKTKKLKIEAESTSFPALLRKVLLGLIVGALMAVVLFVLFMAVGSLIGTAGSEV